MAILYPAIRRAIRPALGDGSGSAAAPDISLQSIVPSTVFDLDSTIALSYPGTGNDWKNLVPAPADGSLQTAYDMLRGDGSTATSFPTFTGSAGSKTAYWLFDGADFFKLKSGTNTTFLNAMHKTTGGSDFWLCVTGRWITTAGAGLISTKNGNVPGIDMLMYNDATGRMAWRQRGDGAEAGLFPTSPNVTSGTDYTAVFTHSHSTNQSRVYLNTNTASETAHTFNTTTTNGTLFHVGALGSSGASPTIAIPNTSRITSVAGGNAYIGDAQVAAMLTFLAARHTP